MSSLAKQQTPEEEENNAQICKAYKHTEEVISEIKVCDRLVELQYRVKKQKGKQRKKCSPGAKKKFLDSSIY